LVAETNAPVRPDDAKGIKGWFFNRYQKVDAVTGNHRLFATGLWNPVGMGSR